MDYHKQDQNYESRVSVSRDETETRNCKTGVKIVRVQYWQYKYGSNICTVKTKFYIISILN